MAPPLDYPPAVVDVPALAAQLARLAVGDLVTYADRLLVRLVVARLVLEGRDPCAFASWWLQIELDARAAVELYAADAAAAAALELGALDDDDAPGTRKPS